MPPRLEALKVTAFRGATATTDVAFDGSPVCVLFGDNGCGKSSLVDALDYVCNGKLGSLEFRRLGSGKRKEEYAIAIGRTESDVAVSIRFAGTTWSATHSRRGATLCATPNRPQAWILRRAELLEFVEEEPAKRYQRLASVIALGEVEQSENALRQAVVDIERSAQDAVRATDQANAALEGFWKAEGSPGTDFISWARGEAGKATAVLTEQIRLASEVIKGIDDAQRLERDATAAATARAAAHQACQEFKAKWDDASARLVAGVGPLIEVLEKAKDYLAEDPQASLCPVCEQRITADSLTSRIDERLVQLQDAIQAKDRFDKASTAEERADDRVTATAKAWASAADQLLMHLDKLKAAVGSSESAVDAVLSGVGTIEGGLSASQRDTLGTHLVALRASVVAARDTDQKTVTQHTAIYQHVKTVDEKTEALRELVVLEARSKQALEIVQSARKDFIEGLLRDVSADVDALYARVHPGEPIGGLRMSLDPSQRGSLRFEGNFQSASAVPPQAYFSESHLDTLGVCIFLSLVKRYARPPSIVVLDDVFTSVDQAHLDRISSLIHDEASHLGPILITTHYRPWREMYRYSRAPGRQAQLLELLPWTVQRGIRHTRTPLVLDDLRQELGKEPLNRQSLASQAGILAESLLDHLTLIYECALPRRPAGAYTLGDLLGGVSSKLAKALKITRKIGTPPTDQIVEIKPLLDALGSMTWIRNQVGCHFSIGGMDVADSQVIEFAKAVLALGDALVCSGCGELPRSDKSGVDRKCRCDVTRLAPLAAPA